jgi:FixJ family two-component response regulator
MSGEATVYIVDDDPAIIRALAELVKLVGLQWKAFSSADEFLASYKADGPGCIVLDVRMPGLSGMELQRTLVNNGVTLPVIIITGHADVRMAVEAMKMGAVEFLEKPFRMQELCDNVQKAVRLDEERWLQRQQKEQADRRFEDLTEAELTVLRLVAAGKTNKAIAGELGLSVRAIEDRRSRMMKKLGVNSRGELLELLSSARPTFEGVDRDSAAKYSECCEN